MRLIDANGLFNKVGKIKPRSKEHYKSIGEFMNLITNSPTIDAVKVVRCRECEWDKQEVSYMSGWKENYCPNCGAKMTIEALKQEEIIRCKECKYSEVEYIYLCKYHKKAVNPDSFCEMGERR